MQADDQIYQIWSLSRLVVCQVNLTMVIGHPNIAHFGNGACWSGGMSTPSRALVLWSSHNWIWHCGPDSPIF